MIGYWKCSKICWKGGGSIIAKGQPARDQIALVPAGARPAPPLKSVVLQPHVKRGAAGASAASTRRGFRRHGGTHEAPCQCRCGPPRGRRCMGPCRRGGRSGSLKSTSPGGRGHTSRSQPPAPPHPRTRTRGRRVGCHPRLVGELPGPPSAARRGAPWAAAARSCSTRLRSRARAPRARASRDAFCRPPVTAYEHAVRRRPVLPGSSIPSSSCAHPPTVESFPPLPPAWHAGGCTPTPPCHR